MNMKHLQTFESFLNENLNEGTAWFPGENIDDFINDGSANWDKFWKGAKKGDTFYSLPDGVEIPSCKKSDVSKSAIQVEVTSIGHNYQAKGDEPGALCTIIDRKKVSLLGYDYDEEDKIDTIFYTIAGDNNRVYLMPEM
jgi:hypothetical protein